MRKTVLALSCLVLVGGFCFSVKAQGSEDVSRRLQRIESDLTILQRQVYRARLGEGSASSGEKVTSSSNSVAAEKMPEPFAAYLTNRINSLEDSLRTLTGQVETLQHNIDTINQRVDRLVGDVDFRLTEIEKNTLNTSGVAAQSSAVSTPVNANSPTKDSAPTDAVNAYNDAYGLLKKGDYAAAEAALERFLAQNPNHDLAGNAQYWLGETYYVRGDFERAVVAFAKGFEKYKNGSKGADSLLKLGLSMANLNKKNEACIALKSFAKEFPKADALKKRAENERKRIGCK